MIRSSRALSFVRSGFSLSILSPLLALGLVAQDPAEGQDQAQAERVLQLSLDDAVRLALEQNLDLESEALSTEVARFNALGTWGTFDPLLSASGSGQEQEQEGTNQLAGGQVIENDNLSLDTTLSYPLTTGGSVSLRLFHSNDRTSNSFSLLDTSTTDVLTLSVNQPLLRGAWERYATTAQREQELNYESQQARQMQVRQQLVLDVYHAYWDLVSGIQQLVVRELAVDRARKQLEQDERRLELGAGTEVDILQSKTNLAQQDEQKLNAQFQLRQAEDTLRRLLFQRHSGQLDEFLEEWDWPIRPLTPLPTQGGKDSDWRASLQNALEQRPEMWQRRFEIDAAEVRLESSRSSRLPQLDLNLSTSSGGFDSDPSESFSEALGWDFPTHTASLDFSVPLRNRTARYAERSARAAVRQARIALDRQELDILSEVRAAVRDLSYRSEALDAAVTSAALAERQLEAEQVRMDIGLSTTFQVLEFQETLASAKSSEVTARAAYAKALIKLVHAEGGLNVGIDDGE